MTGNGLLDVAAALPDGFAIVEKTTVTNAGIMNVGHVLATRAPGEEGRFGRRIANVINLPGKRMEPFDDAPFGAVATLIDAGWTVSR